MPALGLGCWSGTTKEQHDSAQPWIVSALKNGYRHLDTAYGYGTEPAVGRAIRESGIPRKDIWVTTKLPNKHHGPDQVPKSFTESLERFGFTGEDDYFDLYLMHFPQASEGTGTPGEFKVFDIPFTETWAAMEKLFETGKVKALGVSNFSVKNLKILLESAKVKPAVNQIEMHPHQAQPELLEYCNKEGIILTAYSPTGYAQVANDPTVVSIAAKYNVSPAQVSLAWHLARGTTAVPKSTNSERQAGNLWELPKLTQEDVAALTALHKNVHY